MIAAMVAMLILTGGVCCFLWVRQDQFGPNNLNHAAGARTLSGGMGHIDKGRKASAMNE